MIARLFNFWRYACATKAHRKGYVDKAFRQYEKISESNLKGNFWPIVYLPMCRILMEQKRYDDAENVLQQALIRFPNNKDLCLYMAKVLAMQQRRLIDVAYFAKTFLKLEKQQSNNRGSEGFWLANLLCKCSEDLRLIFEAARERQLDDVRWAETVIKHAERKQELGEVPGKAYRGILGERN